MSSTYYFAKQTHPKGTMNREILDCQKLLNILNKNAIGVELRGVTADEVDGEEGVRVIHQIFSQQVQPAKCL